MYRQIVFTGNQATCCMGISLFMIAWGTENVQKFFLIPHDISTNALKIKKDSC